MHALFVTDVYFPRVNGVSTSIQTFAHQLQIKGHRVTLIAPEYAEGTEDNFRIRRISARQVPFDNEDRLMKRGPIRRLLPQIEALAPDLVHIQTPFVAHYEGLRIARRLGVPAIETYHTYFEQYLEHYLPLVPPSGLRWLARRMSVSQCRQVDALVVPTHPMLDVLRSYGVEARCDVVPTGIPGDDFSRGDGAAFRRRLGVGDDRPVLVFVGRVALEKNIGFLIGVLAEVKQKVPDILLVIAGEGPARSALEKDVARRGLAESVRFVGYLSRGRELPDCYAAADLFVFASRTETQGLVLLEAMASGVPVVTTAVLGTAEIMHDGRGGIVCEEDVSEFATAIDRLLKDPGQRAALAADARNKAMGWSDSTLTDRLIALYGELVN